jgi:hypothetical protein
VNLLDLLDALEATADPYLTLDAAQRATSSDLAPLIADGILLVDHRHRLLADGRLEPITLCRLNRHHPHVKALSTWP